LVIIKRDKKIYARRENSFSTERHAMEIEVRFYAHLVEYLPAGSSGNRIKVSLKTGSTIKDLIKELALPDKIAHSILIMVNEAHSNQDQILREGDRISILPPIAGGG
jgi:sulfur carrier protein ThiS